MGGKWFYYKDLRKVTVLHLAQWPWHVVYTSSHVYTEVKQHWARTALVSRTTWELPVQLALVRISMLIRGEWN